MVEDADLVELAQRDRTAFAPLYERYVVAVYRYCYRILEDRDAAEDATSETFTKVMVALDRYQQGSFRSWLFCIAHNVAMDAVRRRKTVHLDDYWEGVDGDPLPDEWVAAKDSHRRLHEMLKHLPEDQQAIIHMRLSGLSGNEIADALNRTPQAVKSAQNRAYKRLRTMLGHDRTESHA
jgi:RNA polymerase sigma-70 factor (ECF subfamily)